MKFELWLEKRNQKSQTKMPKRKTSVELHADAAKKAAYKMKHGRAGEIPLDKFKGSRGSKNRDAIKDQM